MSQSWLYIMGILFLSNIVSNFLGGALWVVALLDVVVLAVSYRILQKDPWLDIRTNMIFLAIMLFLSGLSRFQFIPAFMYYQGLGALLIWSWAGSRSRLFQLIVFGSVFYNAYYAYGLFSSFGFLSWPIVTINVAALLLLAYVNQ